MKVTIIINLTEMFGQFVTTVGTVATDTVHGLSHDGTLAQVKCLGCNIHGVNKHDNMICSDTYIPCGTTARVRTWS